MLSSLCPVIVVPSVAKINTSWVAAKRSIECRKIRLCINSGLHVFRERTGALWREVCFVRTIVWQTVSLNRRFQAFLLFVNWDRMLYPLCVSRGAGRGAGGGKEVSNDICWPRNYRPAAVLNFDPAVNKPRLSSSSLDIIIKLKLRWQRPKY